MKVHSSNLASNTGWNDDNVTVTNIGIQVSLQWLSHRRRILYEQT